MISLKKCLSILNKNMKFKVSNIDELLNSYIQDKKINISEKSEIVKKFRNIKLNNLKTNE